MYPRGPTYGFFLKKSVYKIPSERYLSKLIMIIKLLTLSPEGQQVDFCEN